MPGSYIITGTGGTVDNTDNKMESPEIRCVDTALILREWDMFTYVIADQLGILVASKMDSGEIQFSDNDLEQFNKTNKDTSEVEIVTTAMPDPNMMESPKTSSIPATGELSRSSPSSNETENITPSIYTRDGTVDFRGNPAVRATTGGKRTTAILLVHYALINLAFGGVAVNLVVFLRRVLHQENSQAANNVSKWTGTVYIFSLFGAFLSDSYMGRYITCIVFQVIYLVGLVMLSLSAWFFLVVPSRCGDGIGLRPCQRPSQLGLVMFQLSTYTTAFGIGGYQPSVATFGADQFDDSDNDERSSKLAFFSYFYLALNVGSLFSNSFLAFYEDKGMWTVGFWASAVAAALGLLLFLVGTPYYRHCKPTGNPLTRMAQVLTAAYHKRHLETPLGEDLHEVEDEDYSGVQGTRKLLHREQFRCLDKAAIATEEDYHAGNIKNPWRLCTVTQVEEVKCVLSLIPIWFCTIVYSIEFTQMASTFVEQGTAMDTKLFGRFRVPAASMSVFDVFSVVLSVFAYRYALAPMAKRLKLTKNPDGITDLQRMGVGLVIALIGMLAAAVVEIYRRRLLVSKDLPSPMSVLWQGPQYALIGASEVFMYIGQLDFFGGQMPDGLKSFGSSLCMASMSLGNFASMLTVGAVAAITTRKGRKGWITKNINYGHLERFFLVLVGLSVLDFVIFLAFAIIYKGTEFKAGGKHITRI